MSISRTVVSPDSDLPSHEFGNGLSHQCAPRGERGPEFIWNRLEVSGPEKLLYDFIGAASGPGFVDWRPEWHGVYEQIYFEAARGGAPTREAAEYLARKLRDILWRRHEEERVRAELDSHRVPLDLNALIPIPRAILRKGFVEAGQDWMWGNWGVRWPIRRVSFAIERRDAGGVKPVAVFRFLSEDWSPWIALLHMRERWRELRFEMKAEYFELIETRAGGEGQSDIAEHKGRYVTKLVVRHCRMRSKRSQ